MDERVDQIDRKADRDCAAKNVIEQHIALSNAVAGRQIGEADAEQRKDQNDPDSVKHRSISAIHLRDKAGPPLEEADLGRAAPMPVQPNRDARAVPDEKSTRLRQRRNINSIKIPARSRRSPPSRQSAAILPRLMSNGVRNNRRNRDMSLCSPPLRAILIGWELQSMSF
jgi:hypothetical protein